MKKIILIRNTFRIHENPLLEYYNKEDDVSIIFIIDTNRLLTINNITPKLTSDNIDSIDIISYDNEKNKGHFAWGYHQYYLLLKCIQNHQIQLNKMDIPSYILKGECCTILKLLSKTFTECITDIVDDPAVFQMNNFIKKYFDKSTFVCTHTLIDWHNDHNHQKMSNQKFKTIFMEKYYPLIRKDSIFSNNNTKKHKKRSILTKSKYLYNDIDTEISDIYDLFKKHNVNPIHIDNDDVEQHALNLLERSVSVFKMNNTKWFKPDTASDLLFDSEDSLSPFLNTSKLSPFLAIGAISCIKVFHEWNTHSEFARIQSSAIGQLLWRELFHAASTLPYYWELHHTTLKPEKTFWKEYDWDHYTTNNSYYLEWIKGNTSYEDTDEAMYILARDGWIHHLRRHVVADYLTRGHAKCDWMLGEGWFRQTLVDHDAAVNRANWLWLSASAFSYKQSFIHYKHSDYVTRQSATSRKKLDPKKNSKKKQ